MTAGGSSSRSPRSRRAGAPPPTSMVIAGYVVSAFGVRQDVGASERLTSETAARGFRGERETDHWCCSLHAIVHGLVDQGVLIAPSTTIGGVDVELGRLLTLMAVSTEAAWWDHVVQHGAASPLAHFRYTLISGAHRVGALLAEHDLPAFLEDHPAWLDEGRAGEPWEHIRQAGGVTKSKFAKDLGFPASSVTRWSKHGGRPRPYVLRALAGWARRHLEYDEDWIHRSLRWHFGLGRLIDMASEAMGRDVVFDAASVALSILRCTRLAARERLASGHLDDDYITGVLLSAVQDLDDIDVVADHARRHGANEEFVADLHEAHAAFRRAAATCGETGGGPPSKVVLARSLPRTPGPGASLATVMAIDQCRR